MLSRADGTAFLETMNLDGETNLKVRESLEATHKALTRPCKDSDGNEAAEVVLREIARFEATAVCNEPDSLLYEFSAKLKYTGRDLPLNGGASGGQFLQRSAKLRNTRFVVGLAVYTGKETKIQSNMMDPPVKVSNIERRVNTYIIGVFVLFMVLCTVSATANSENMKWNRFAEAWYMASAFTHTQYALTRDDGACTHTQHMLPCPKACPVRRRASTDTQHVVSGTWLRTSQRVHSSRTSQGLSG